MSIINQSKNLTVYSFSIVIYNTFEDARNSEDLEKIKKPKKFMVYTGCEVGFLFATLVGVIETVFWAAIALVCKIPHALFPESKSKWANLVYAQILRNLNGAATGLSSGAVMTVINYFDSNESIKETQLKVSGTVDRILEKFNPVFSYHLFK